MLPYSRLRFSQKNNSVLFQTRQKTQPAWSCQCCSRDSTLQCWFLARLETDRSSTFKFRTALGAIKFSGTNHIRTWWICRLWSCERLLSSIIQMCDVTAICGVSDKSGQILSDIHGISIATPCIVVEYQKWQWAVSKWLKVHNLSIQHVTKQSVVKYWIATKICRWNVEVLVVNQAQCQRSGLVSVTSRCNRLVLVLILFWNCYSSLARLLTLSWVNISRPVIWITTLLVCIKRVGYDSICLITFVNILNSILFFTVLSGTLLSVSSHHSVPCSNFDSIHALPRWGRCTPRSPLTLDAFFSSSSDIVASVFWMTCTWWPSSCLEMLNTHFVSSWSEAEACLPCRIVHPVISCTATVHFTMYTHSFVFVAQWWVGWSVFPISGPCLAYVSFQNISWYSSFHLRFHLWLCTVWSPVSMVPPSFHTTTQQIISLIYLTTVCMSHWS